MNDDGGGRDIIVVGASAGGLGPLQRLLRAMPRDLAAALFVVLHRAPVESPLVKVLRWQVAIPVDQAVDGETFERGHAYVAPPDQHLLVERGRIRLERSPRESRVRPSVDALFRSAALTYGRRVVGILLSGIQADGSAGLWQVKKHGGVTIVQDLAEAQHPGMPGSALEHVSIDYCSPVDAIARIVIEMAARKPAPPPLTGPRGGRVLIVEDERIVARNLELRLRDFGYDVAGSVGSGEAAILAAGVMRPDVVLMDIRLPGPTTGPRRPDACGRNSRSRSSTSPRTPTTPRSTASRRRTRTGTSSSRSGRRRSTPRFSSPSIAATASCAADRAHVIEGTFGKVTVTRVPALD